MELRFIRDTDRREIDFVVIQNKSVLFAVECKSGERKVSPAIQYFRERTRIQQFYQVHMGAKDYHNKGTRILPYHVFCKELGLP